MTSTLAQALADAKSKNEGCFDVMIDIETMGPPPVGALCSIGLVRFNRHTGEIGRSIHLAIKLRSSVAVGMKINPDTVIWWAMQEADAGRALVRGAEDIGLQLDTLRQYFTPEDTVWAGPIRFDLVILSRAYELCGLKRPWHEMQERCMTKLRDEAKKKQYVTKVERQGTHHNAEDDALTQALTVIDIVANI